MRRKRKSLTPDTRSRRSGEILDQFVRQGRLSPEELDAAVAGSRRRSSSAPWAAS
jgi:hypothetical protein